MLWFHLFRDTHRATSHERTTKKHASLCECVYVCVSGSRQATSWPVKLWVTIYHLLGFTCFTSINDKNGCDAICNAGHHTEIVFSAIHAQKKVKRITEINWIFDLSWHKFDVNEIGHYTCALSSCRRRHRCHRHHRRHHQIDSGGWHEKLPFHCTVGSISRDIGLVSVNYICDDMAIESKYRRREKKKLNLII